MNLPTFVAKTEDINGRTQTHFDCPACGQKDAVDVVCGLCVGCWRVAVLVGIIVREELAAAKAVTK